MRKLSKIAAIICLLSMPAFAETEIENADLGNYKAHGGLEVEHSSFKSLIVHGGLEFEDLIVSGDLKIHGGAEGNNLKAMNMKVHGGIDATKVFIEKNTSIHGKSKLYHSVFQGEFESYGKMQAKDSKFQEIFTSARKVILDDCIIENNIIFDITHNNAPQEIILKGKTVVKGNIEFVSGKGIVNMGRSVKVLGSVKGGKTK